MNADADARLEIAVVEDETRLRDLLVREIAEMGHGAIGFRTAEDAWPCIERGDFDALLLDLNLPGMNGMELFQLVREAKLDVSVVVLTGFGGFDSAIQALRWDADDYLTKPCTLDQIERVLTKLAAAKHDEYRSMLAERKATEVQQADAGATRPPPAPPVDEDSLQVVERQHILKVLEACKGNKRQAADILGISLRTLYNRLNLYARDRRFR